MFVSLRRGVILWIKLLQFRHSAFARWNIIYRHESHKYLWKILHKNKNNDHMFFLELKLEHKINVHLMLKMGAQHNCPFDVCGCCLIDQLKWEENTPWFLGQYKMCTAKIKKPRIIEMKKSAAATAVPQPVPVDPQPRTSSSTRQHKEEQTQEKG